VSSTLGPDTLATFFQRTLRDPLHMGQTLFFNTSGQGTPNSFPIDSFDSVEKVMGWEFMGVLGMFVPRFCRSSIRLIQMQSRYKNIRQQKDQLILIQFQKVSKPVQVPLAFRLLTSPRIHPRRPQICWGTLVNFTCKSVVEILQALLQEGFSSFHQEGKDFFQFTTQLNQGLKAETTNLHLLHKYYKSRQLSQSIIDELQISPLLASSYKSMDWQVSR
jgi:hypothetical protein